MLNPNRCVAFWPDMNKSSKSKPVLISVIIITAAVGWIAHRLWDGFDEVLAAISSLEPGFLLLSIVPAMISVFIAAYLYFLVLARSVPKPPPLAHVMGHFIISQVVRHLPGKIWGVFYQANAMTKWVEARATVQANIEHYALMNYNSIAMAISVFALFQYGTTVAMVIFSVALLLLFVALRLSLLKRIVSIIIKITTRSKESMDRSIENKHNLLIVALLQVDWFFYFLTCLIILPAYFSCQVQRMSENNVIIPRVVSEPVYGSL